MKEWISANMTPQIGQNATNCLKVRSENVFAHELSSIFTLKPRSIKHFEAQFHERRKKNSD